VSAIARPRPATQPLAVRSLAAGLIAGVGLLAVYVALISLAQGFDHALEQLAADAPFVSLIAIGFGTQIALFVELRTVANVHRSAAAVTAAGTGTSAAAMLACCAHHLVDLLPILGLSAATMFLNEYKTPLFLVSLGINLAGVIVIARQLRRARQACAVVEGATRGSIVEGATRGSVVDEPRTPEPAKACH